MTRFLLEVQNCTQTRQEYVHAHTFHLFCAQTQPMKYVTKCLAHSQGQKHKHAS